jgi:hypothetical protein
MVHQGKSPKEESQAYFVEHTIVCTVLPDTCIYYKQLNFISLSLISKI